MPRARPPRTPRALVEIARRSSQVRTCDPERRIAQGTRYHKGDEVRIVTHSREELEQVRTMLFELGMKPGRPFEKQRYSVLPLYGAAAVEWYRGLFPERVSEGWRPPEWPRVRRPRSDRGQPKRAQRRPRASSAPRSAPRPGARRSQGTARG